MKAAGKGFWKVSQSNEASAAHGGDSRNALRQINETAIAAMQLFHGHKQEQVMVRIAVLLWAIGGTVLAGIAVMTVLAVPALAGHAMSYIPYAALAGFIVAIPVAVIVARQIGKIGKTATH